MCILLQATRVFLCFYQTLYRQDGEVLLNQLASEGKALLFFFFFFFFFFLFRGEVSKPADVQCV